MSDPTKRRHRVNWNAVAALSAVLAVLTSCWFSYRSLQSSDAALEQARIEHTAQIKQSELSARDAEKNREEAARQFGTQINTQKEIAAEQQRQAHASLLEQKRQSDESLAEHKRQSAAHLAAQRQLWLEETQLRKDEFYQARMPRIAPLQCCNYRVAIMLVNSKIDNFEYVRLPVSKQDKDTFPEHYNAGYVAKLVNLGTGAAEMLSADWVVSEYKINSSGTIQTIVVKEGDAFRHSDSYTYPNHILAEGEAEIRHLPLPLWMDGSRSVTEVSGNVVFSYYHTLDKGKVPMRWACDFQMTPDYNPEPADGIQQPPKFLHVHLGDLHRTEPLIPREAVEAVEQRPTQVLPGPAAPAK